jgi:hypothetical protein
MPHLVLQFAQLENLLDEAVGTDRLRVHTLERTRKTSVQALTQVEIAIGVCVRAVMTNDRILSWYCEIDAYRSFVPELPADSSPAKARYESAWKRADILQARLVAYLNQREHIVTTDGLIELEVDNFLRGSTNLIPLPPAET